MPLSPINVSRFRSKLLRWYAQHQRPLPWRKTRSSYRIWVSEIMLQQTRVAVVVDRYREFLKRFPSLQSLAKSRESEVLAAWSGLGYYRRARSLRNAARLVLRDFSGRLPRDFERLKSLPGVGDYTAAAIASIAFGKPHAVVDGNVQRVLTRITGRKLGSGATWKLAQEMLSPEQPGDFNQAMMELGATVCLPVPKCGDCPVFRSCASQGVSETPQKVKLVTKVSIHLVLAHRQNHVYLVRRSGSNTIMPAMWELPEVAHLPGGAALRLRHCITTTNYTVMVSRFVMPPSGVRGKWVPCDRLHTLPLTGLTRKILRRTGILENPVVRNRTCQR